MSHQGTPWYADLVNFKVCGVMPPGLSYQQKKTFLSGVKYFVREEHLLYKLCRDGVYKRCLPKDEAYSVLHDCHGSTYSGQFGPTRPLLRCFKWVSIRPFSSKMRETLSWLVIDANRQGLFPKGMICLNMGFLRQYFLTLRDRLYGSIFFFSQ